MRARLLEMAEGEIYQCICDLKMASKMERVIQMAGGVMASRKSQPEGILIVVRK